MSNRREKILLLLKRDHGLCKSGLFCTTTFTSSSDISLDCKRTSRLPIIVHVKVCESLQLARIHVVITKNVPSALSIRSPSLADVFPVRVLVSASYKVSYAIRYRGDFLRITIASGTALIRVLYRHVDRCHGRALNCGKLERHTDGGIRDCRRCQ